MEELFLGVRSVNFLNVEPLIFIVTQYTFNSIQMTLVILLVGEEVVNSRFQELQSNFRVHFTLTSASLHNATVHCL